LKTILPWRNQLLHRLLQAKHTTTTIEHPPTHPRRGPQEKKPDIRPTDPGTHLPPARSQGRSGRSKAVKVESSSRRLAAGPQRPIFGTDGRADGFDFGRGPDFNGVVRRGSQQFQDILQSMEQVRCPKTIWQHNSIARFFMSYFFKIIYAFNVTGCQILKTFFSKYSFGYASFNTKACEMLLFHQTNQLLVKKKNLKEEVYMAST
jgi:hypothetical protein